MTFRTLLLHLLLIQISVMVHADNDAALDMLQGYEWQLSEKRLSELGPDAYRSFLSIARDKTQANFIRARAMTTLTHFPNEEVWNYFESGLTSEQGLSNREKGGAEKVYSRQLVEGLCASFLESRPEQVSEILMPLLEANDAQLRIRTANCLQSVDGKKAERALSDYQSKISEPWELKAAGFQMEIE